MTDVIQALVDQRALFYWGFALTLAWAFIRFVNSENNDLEWVEFITSRGDDGKFHPDLDKTGKAAGIIIGSWAVVTISAGVKNDFAGFAGLLFVYFAFVGAIAGYSAYLRSKAGQATVVTTTEPLPIGPTKVTVTETSTVSKDSPMPVEIVSGPGVETPVRVTDVEPPVVAPASKLKRIHKARLSED